MTIAITVFVVFDRGERLWFQSMAVKYLNRLLPKKHAQ
jgi:hypothetical protein